MKIREKMQRKDKQKGFTLVELMVVMAILAVLAALAVPRFSAVLTNAKTSANDTNEEMIVRAAEMYIADKLTQGDQVDELTTATLVTNKYLKGNNTGGTDIVGPNGESYEIDIDDGVVSVSSSIGTTS